MRWESLFEDLEASFGAEADAGLAAEIAEATRLERSSVRLSDRLRASRGEEVRLLVRGGRRIALRVGVVGEDWLAGSQGHYEVLVPLSAVQSMTGLPRAGQQERSETRRRLSIASPLRELVRDRATVSLAGAEGTLVEGLLMDVGRDAVDVLPAVPGEIPRTRRLEDVETIPLSAIVLISSEG